MALRYHPPSIVVEYAKKGKLYHHRMDLPLPPGGEIPRDEVHTTAQLQQTHNNYLQNVSVEQIRLFVRMLLDHQRMKASGTDFTVGQRVEVHWRKENTWYPGKVVRVTGPTSFAVDYDDGDKESSVDCKRMRLEGSRPKERRVSFAPKLVGTVKTRPRTAVQDKAALFYNGDDLDRFQMEAAQEAFSNGSAEPHQDSNFVVESPESDDDDDYNF
eukprot:g2402.t1